MGSASVAKMRGVKRKWREYKDANKGKKTAAGNKNDLP